MKKLLCIFLSLFSVAATLLCAVPAAAQNSYVTQLKNAGFPDSYATQLAELKEKYPNWIFEPMFVGVDFDEAVAQERTPHSQQLIQMYSGNNNKGYYCTCSSCYKNGSYVIQEGSTWVSASQSAVEYYMDPRNFFDERYIFQFETTAYDASQTTSGIETIIRNTWMYNSNITYKDSNGTTRTYTSSTYPNGVKYSQAILNAAKNSGVSAYYLASRIVQEVGGKTNSAGGASGTNSTYPGIYNYYNIGANTGYLDGLRWAATSVADNKTNVNANMRSAATTNSSLIVTVPSGTTVSILSTTGTQADGYKWHRVTATVKGRSYTGYIRSDLIGDAYNRPWTNPYDSIINGAVYIAENFSQDQNTGYLQKFNVNPESSNMYAHEYMANVQAPSSEARNTYNAYREAGVLSAERTFIIPVFDNMPGDELPAVRNVKVTNITSTSATISYNKVSGADGYEIQFYYDGAWHHYVNTGYNSKVWSTFSPSSTYTLRVRAYRLSGDTVLYSPNWSSTVKFQTLADPEKLPAVKNVTFSDITSDSVKISYDKVTGADGYEIQYLNGNGEWKHYVNTGYTSKVWSGFDADSPYTIRVRAYGIVNGTVIYSQNWSGTYTFTTAAEGFVDLPAVQNISVTNTTANSADISYNKVSGADGYEIQFYLNGKWKHYVNTGYYSKTWSGLSTSTKFQMRVRAYRIINGSIYYSENWSSTASFSTKPTKVTGIKTANRAADGRSITLSWNAQTNADGYTVYRLSGSSWTAIATVSGGANNSYTVSGLTPDTAYSFKVRAYKTGTGNLGAFSDAHSTSTLVNGSSIAQVKNIVTSNTTDNSVNIAYDRVSGADGYEIQFYLNGEWKHYVNTGYYSKTWSGLSTSTKFQMRVRAYRIIDGTIVYSTNWSSTASFSTKPTKVTGVKTTARSENGTSLTLTWNAQTNADGYTVYRLSGSSWTAIATISGGANNSYTVSGLTPDTAYSFKVRAYKTGTGNLGAFSDAHSTSTLVNGSSIAQVKNIVTSNTTDNSVNIAYDRVSGADGYEIQFYLNGEWKHYVNTGYYSKTWSGLSTSTKFQMRVRAYRIIDGTIVYSTNWSSTASFSTKPTKVTGVKTTARSENGTSLTLTWNAQTNADGYTVYRLSGSSWTAIATISGGANNSYTVSGLTPDTAYSFKVRAYKTGTGNLGEFSDAHSTSTAAV